MLALTIRAARSVSLQSRLLANPANTKSSGIRQGRKDRRVRKGPRVHKVPKARQDLKVHRDRQDSPRVTLIFSGPVFSRLWRTSLSFIYSATRHRQHRGTSFPHPYYYILTLMMAGPLAGTAFTVRARPANTAQVA